MSGMVAEKTRYIRKRGTAEIFAFSERLMMRGDMINYEGPVPVPSDFVVPREEIEMLNAIKEAKQGNLNPYAQNKTTTFYVRKLGTKEIFAYSPALMARGDMVPYAGAIPVPIEFVVPPEEMEMLIYQGKMERPKEMVPEPAPMLGLDAVPDAKADEWAKPPDVPATHGEKIAKIVEVIKTMAPEEFSVKTGLPDARVIMRRLGGVMVRGDERDEAWAIVKAEVKDDNPGHSE